ncbi:MAG: T9SS type A sorting domain-containing protein [Bacteroidales bacterium]|nr:T9SS type A sorting domain-containing protein [Bacteroidales bacterium]
MRKSFIFLVFIYTLFLFGLNNGPVTAQWTSIGPEGGYIHCMTRSGNNLYAVSGMYFLIPPQLFVSTDNGLSWSKMNSITFPDDVRAIASIGNYIFIGTGSGVFRSDDNGLTWIKKINGFPYGEKYINYLAVSDTSLFAAGTGSGLIRSTDYGENWTTVTNGLTDTYLYSLTANETTVFAGTGDNNLGVFRSTDNGATWLQVSDGMAYYYNGNWIPNMAPMITSLAYVGSDLYAGTSEFQGIWKSSDDGDNWVFTSMETMNYNTISAISGNESMVLAGSFNGEGIIKSNDGGVSWIEANHGIDVYGLVSTFLMESGNTFVSTKGGIYKSVNNGDSWTNANSGIKADQITGFAVFDTDLYVGAGGGGVFHSTDEGMSWNTVNNGLPISEWTLDGLKSNSTAMFVWDRLSFDGGNTWEMSNIYSPGSISFGFDGPRWLEHGNAWFAINSYENAGVYRSTDNGQNWTTITNGINNPSNLLYMNINSDGPTLFLGTSEAPYYSTDNGDTWHAGSFPGINNWALGGAEFLSTGTSHLYGLVDGGGSKGIYRSADNGSHWLKVFDGLVTGNFVMLGTDIFVSGWTKEIINDEEVIIKQILVSHDDGQNWTKLLSEEISNINISSFIAADSKLFFSTSAGPEYKVYCSVDNGNNWVNISDGLSQKTMVSSLYEFNDKLYAGTGTSSVWSRNLSEFVIPTQPSPIVGSETPCIGSSQTYSVTNVPGVNYTWQAPQDWTIVSGNGTNSITVNIGNSTGLVLVIPSNNFGSGPSQYLMVSPVAVSEITAGIEADQNNVCEGVPITFTSNTTNGGNQPVYNWFVNGLSAGDNSAAFSYTPVNNDVVSMIFSSNAACLIENPVTSNTITAIVNPIPEVSWTNFEYDTLCITWLPVNLSGGLPAGGIYSGNGVTNNVFNPSVAGAGDHVITYTWSDGNDCTNTTSITLSVNSCLGIEELSSATLVYPNPATYRLTIVLPDNRVIREIALFNLMGTKVFEMSSINASGSVTLPVQDIPSGNYIIRINGNDESIVKPIILK